MVLRSHVGSEAEPDSPRGVVGSLTALLACQLVGEIISRGFALPVPGPVLGMLVLLGLLVVRGGPPPALERTSLGMLEYLSLLFVPAGVGIVRYVDLVAREWIPIAAAIAGSTVLAIAVTGWVMNGVERARGARPGA